MPKQASKTSLVITPDDLALNGDIADASAFNLSFRPVYREFGLPDLATPGEVIREKPVFGLTGDWDSKRPGDNNITTQLDSGLRQDTSDGVITFAFFTGQHALGLNNNPQLGEGKGYTPFSAAQMAAGRLAMSNWDELIAAKIVEITPEKGAKTWAQGTVDIFLANTTTGPAQAWAYYPGYGKQYTRVAGDVWISDPRYNSSNAQLDPGFYGLQTLNHEIGHALGLSHPGDYNFGDDNDGDGQPDPITYEGDAFYFQDSNQYTIMSYFDSYEAGNNQVDWNLMRFIYPSTPMIDDIAIIQAKYGADLTTRTGDTVYGFNATADVTNAAMSFKAGEMLTIFSIWDAGGNDTLDLSGYYTNSVIDLRDGAFSSAGGFGAYSATLADTDPSAMSKADYMAFINANNKAAGLGPRSDFNYSIYFEGNVPIEGTADYYNEGIPWFDIMGQETLIEHNIGIARGAIIENAIGGFGDDRINGNQANNVLTGGAGADTFVIAKFGASDTSIDTITDFASGEDKLDFTSFAGLTMDDVTIDNANDTIYVDTDKNGSDDLTLIVHGSDVVATDFIFG